MTPPRSLTWSPGCPWAAQKMSSASSSDAFAPSPSGQKRWSKGLLWLMLHTYEYEAQYGHRRARHDKKRGVGELQVELCCVLEGGC